MSALCLRSCSLSTHTQLGPINRIHSCPQYFLAKIIIIMDASFTDSKNAYIHIYRSYYIVLSMTMKYDVVIDVVSVFSLWSWYFPDFNPRFLMQIRTNITVPSNVIKT